MPIVTLREYISQTYMTSQCSFGKTLRHIVFHRALGKSELDSDLFEGIGGVNSMCLTCAMIQALSESYQKPMMCYSDL